MTLKRYLVLVNLMGTILLFIGVVIPNAGGGATIQDVKHVVILMQENRSFDHYYGAMQGVRGYNDPNIRLFQNGSSVLFQPNATNYVLPFPLANDCNYNVMGYYTRSGLPFYYALADAYTVCDANYCSVDAPTFPNRIFLFTGMIDPAGTHGGPSVDDSVPTNGYTWTTYPERLQAAGVTWKVYRPPGDWFGDALQWFTQYKNAAPGNPLYDRGIATVNDVIGALAADVTNGTLPQVSWVIPMDGIVSEHGPWSVQLGEWFVSRVVAALAANPAIYESTVFILTYDENGGYFDHALSPLAPPRTADELVTRGRAGLGVRVPMIIASPWTRGGRVCSQVFDHTSVIRFLETWTGVQETNISAWRRQVCGDLTSAFDFAHPDFSVPALPPAPHQGGGGVLQSPPAIQSVPVQELGVRPSCPLPYQPDASCSTDCNSNRIFITMTNAGASSVHFAIFANAFRADGPWQYDAAPAGSVRDSFAVPLTASGGYDFTCYGPNGFQRRFAGNLNRDCNQIEITSLINSATESLALRMINSGASPVNFTVTDTRYAGTNWIFNVAPAGSTTTYFAPTNHGWYDLTVTAGADTNFVRHLAGHIENGSFSFTDVPAIVGNTLARVPSTNMPASPTNQPIVSISDVVNQLIAQNASASSGTNFLTLAIGASATNYALVYPGWASNYVLEFNASLTTTGWVQPNAVATTISNFNVIILPETNAAGFFRLRH
ncbi:MAG: alkaline phosphatase family protein [Verrucomicrobiota bacterium]